MTANQFETLIQMLAYRANVSASKVAFTFNGNPRTFEELWRGVNYFASILKKLGIQRNECVVLAIPNSPEFFFAFYGVQRAGGVAVPIFPGSGKERILGIAGLCHARYVVLPSNIPAKNIRQMQDAGKGQGVSVVTSAEADAEVKESGFPVIQSDDVAFIQYTSGSTGSPKGVMLTHAN